MKPFILLTCFITECDEKYYDMHIKMANYGQQCTIIYEFSDIFWHTMSVLIGEKSFMCGRIVKLNGQGETFACVSGNGPPLVMH